MLIVLDLLLIIASNILSMINLLVNPIMTLVNCRDYCTIASIGSLEPTASAGCASWNRKSMLPTQSCRYETQACTLHMGVYDNQGIPNVTPIVDSLIMRTQLGTVPPNFGNPKP